MFAGFQSSDFETYAPNKWRSNVFNRERLEVKQKLLALGRELEADLRAADGSPLELEASVEHPALWNHKQVDAQHLFFSRNQGARKELDGVIDRQKSIASIVDDPTPQRNHMFLAVTLHQAGLDLSVRLHPDARVDRENLTRKCDDHFERERLLALVHALGESHRVGLLPQLTGAAAVDDALLSQVLAALAAAPPTPPLGQPPASPLGPTGLFYVGHSLTRDACLSAGPALIDTVRSDLGKLLAVYQFAAWTRENDFVSFKETLQKEKTARRQKGLSKNDEVRIVRGMLSGKTGIVQEIDARGGMKLLVGKMVVKVDADDVQKRE